MQPPKKDVNFLQRLVIQLSTKPRAPTTSILYINHQASLEEAIEKKSKKKSLLKANLRTTYPFQHFTLLSESTLKRVLE